MFSASCVASILKRSWGQFWPKRSKTRYYFFIGWTYSFMLWYVDNTCLGQWVHTLSDVTTPDIKGYRRKNWSSVEYSAGSLNEFLHALNIGTHNDFKATPGVKSDPRTHVGVRIGPRNTFTWIFLGALSKVSRIYKMLQEQLFTPL